jgi:5-methylcytosine-specific restriction protein A
VECLKKGLYVRATDVDHIKPHRGDKKLFWDTSNWQALCHSHHSIKTNREDHFPVYSFKEKQNE